MTAEEKAEAERLLRELDEVLESMSGLTQEECYALACEAVGREEVERRRQEQIEMLDDMALRFAGDPDPPARKLVREAVAQRDAVFRPIAKRPN